MKEYDLIVIGAGPGGYVAAIRAAQKGMKTAVVEKKHLGGCCLNRGCAPTKSIMHAAHLYSEIKHASKYGLEVSGLSFDLDKIYEQKNTVVKDLRQGVERLFKAHGIALYQGSGVITSANTVLVRGEQETTLSAKFILIATGGTPATLPEHLQQMEGVYTSDDLLAEEAVNFKRIVVLGAGVIGVEFATIYNYLGCEVSMISKYDRPLRKLDKDVSQNLSMILKKRGIKIYKAPTITDIQKTEMGLVCTFAEKEAEKTIEADAVLVSIGWRPNTKGLFEEYQEVIYDSAGSVLVNENFQTNIGNIYAIGDVIPSVKLAHVASAQGMNAVSHMVGENEGVDMGTVPSCVYTDPEIATVGLSESEAKDAGREVKIGKYLMTGNAKSMITGQERGFIKTVFDAKTGAILGAQLMCGRATDLVSEFAVAISNGLTVHELTKVIHPHPTFTEGALEAFEDVEKMSIHAAPKIVL